MMTRDKFLVTQRFASVLMALAFVLAGMSASLAGQATSSSLSLQRKPQSQKIFTPNSVRLTQRLNNYGQTHNPGSGGKPPSDGKRPPRGGGGGGGGGGISIGIDINTLFNNPGYQQPPRRVYRKPKKKKTNTARRRPRRNPTPTFQPIPQFFPNEVVVLVDGAQPDGVDDALAQALGLTKLSSVPVALLDGRLVRYRISDGRSVQQTIAALTSDPRVSLAQPNNVYFTLQKTKRASSASAQYSLGKLGLPSAHKISQGRNVPVAVIDTGVDVTHPVLAKRVSQSFDAVGKGKADVQPHGTAIAGLIAGQGKVKGVAPLASLLAVRAFYMHPVYKRPVTSSEILLRSLDWAFTSKARIFNMSFAGPFDPLVKAALTSAYSQGVVLVAAAGNGGPKAMPAYPAAYENVIAITALDSKDKLYAHANRGRYLAVAAPGVDVLVPSLKNGYRFSSGTSLAAAHVSGLVALLIEQHPNASAEDILKAIQNSAHDLGPKGHDVEFGAGRADAHASLLSMTDGQVKLTSGQ